jgi:hypothetical protein
MKTYDHKSVAFCFLEQKKKKQQTKIIIIKMIIVLVIYGLYHNKSN